MFFSSKKEIYKWSKENYDNHREDNAISMSKKGLIAFLNIYFPEGGGSKKFHKRFINDKMQISRNINDINDSAIIVQSLQTVVLPPRLERRARD